MIDMSTSPGTRRTAQRRTSEPAHQAQQRHHGTVDRLDEPTLKGVKGIVDIRTDSVLDNPDLLGRVIGVLIAQWGLDAVEVRIGEYRPEPSEVTDGNRTHTITVAGHPFPLILEAR